jgi:hypothetical protein
VRLVYDPIELSGVTTVRPGVAGCYIDDRHTRSRHRGRSTIKHSSGGGSGAACVWVFFIFFMQNEETNNY